MWYLLAVSLSVLSLNKQFAYAILLIAAIAGWFENVIEIPALTLITLVPFGWYVIQTQNKKTNCMYWLVETVLALVSFGLALHCLPGFNNPRILDLIHAGPLSAPFSMYYNFDKALIPFVLSACMGTLFVVSIPGRPGVTKWILLVLAIPALLLTAVALGGLRIEPHWPDWLPQFVFANIFFVSLAEEALFRGYLLQRLYKYLHPVVALIISSIAFGAMHCAGGILLVIFATLAGIIYGLAWMWSGKLWVAVLFHFGLNCTQLLFFTYPYLKAHQGM